MKPASFIVLALASLAICQPAPQPRPDDTVLKTSATGAGLCNLTLPLTEDIDHRRNVPTLPPASGMSEATNCPVPEDCVLGKEARGMPSQNRSLQTPDSGHRAGEPQPRDLEGRETKLPPWERSSFYEKPRPTEIPRPLPPPKDLPPPWERPSFWEAPRPTNVPRSAATNEQGIAPPPKDLPPPWERSSFYEAPRPTHHVRDVAPDTGVAPPPGDMPSPWERSSFYEAPRLGGPTVRADSPSSFATVTRITGAETTG